MYEIKCCRNTVVYSVYIIETMIHSDCSINDSNAMKIKIYCITIYKNYPETMKTFSEKFELDISRDIQMFAL